MFKPLSTLALFCGLSLGACAVQKPAQSPGQLRAAGIEEIVVCNFCDEKRRLSYAAEVVAAEQIIQEFAKQHGWQEAMKQPLFDQVQIYETQEQLWKAILRMHQLPITTEIPTSGLAAALEKRKLMAVRPETYQRIRPEYARHPQAWTRLLAHEIGHRPHVAILKGNEEAMGPTWFFEAFACLAAGQRLGEPLEFNSLAEVKAGVEDKGPGAYRRYLAALRFMLKNYSLRQLVQKAGVAKEAAKLLAEDNSEALE